MTWWFDPERRNELWRRTQEEGATDFSLTESIGDGVRVETVHFADRVGWDHDHRTEMPLASMAEQGGDRFIALAGDVNRLRSPHGKKFTFTCTCRIEFVPQPTGATDINVAHEHRVVGSTWFQRRVIVRANTADEERLFNERIVRLRTAMEDGLPE